MVGCIPRDSSCWQNSVYPLISGREHLKSLWPVSYIFAKWNCSIRGRWGRGRRNFKCFFYGNLFLNLFYLTLGLVNLVFLINLKRLVMSLMMSFTLYFCTCSWTMNTCKIHIFLLLQDLKKKVKTFSKQGLSDTYSNDRVSLSNKGVSDVSNRSRITSSPGSIVNVQWKFTFYMSEIQFE